MKLHSIPKRTAVVCTALLAFAALMPLPAHASSHMDAPLITLDPAANTTDVYAFLTQKSGAKFLDLSLAVYPFEEPGIGPNKYNFDDNVLYEIHVALGADVAAGNPTITYQFRFTTSFKNQNTILQSYTGVVNDVDDANQNLTQTYTVTAIDRRTTPATTTQIGTGKVPPNNQGIATPFYNTGNDGNNLAKPGVNDPANLDKYTTQSIINLTGGGRAFAGQREDGFYADIQSVFDLLNFRKGTSTFDSQAGFNLHEMILEIPVSSLGGDQQVVGVYATTSRQTMRVLSAGPGSTAPVNSGAFVQVGRQGNPLFNEGLVAIVDKDLYSRTQPNQDSATFDKYARTPELAKLINQLVFKSTVAPETNRTDLVGIFIPDLIKTDLSTGPARLAGGGSNFAANPDDNGFSRLGIFGMDTLTSTVQTFLGSNQVPGGWPNGRRFGDDVLDIAVSAIISDLRTSPPTIRSADGIDNVSKNDSVYSKVFPYAGTPHNGRNHDHHDVTATGAGSASRFQNVSTRGNVMGGDNVLIGGIIVGGTGNKSVLVRALGPSLPVPGPLADPVLLIYQGSTKIAENDNWKTGGQQAAIMATGKAPMKDTESAIIIDLAPGVYTMLVGSHDTTTGIGLVEAYELP
ncbi:MAG: DUF4331 domain-containing protein [Verrucomicrobiota bacterium]|nr:DUF4331 domain-containing protein [Verrucomicrobiota bacterium]